MVEHLTVNQVVTGSSPVTGAIFFEDTTAYYGGFFVSNALINKGYAFYIPANHTLAVWLRKYLSSVFCVLDKSFFVFNILVKAKLFL